MSEDYEQGVLFDIDADMSVEDQLELLHSRVDRLDTLVGMLYESTCQDMQTRLQAAVRRSQGR